MAEETEKKTDSERIAEGQVLARVILEMLGAPKDHIEKTMKEYLESIKTHKDYAIAKSKIAEAIEQDPDEKQKKDYSLGSDKKLYSIYAEVEIWFRDSSKIIEFCFDSLPSSVEILEPEEFKLKAHQFTGLINDLQAKLHKLDMVFKSHNADQQAAGQIFRTLMLNFIAYCIRSGKNTTEDISQVIGIQGEKVQKLLDEMVEKKVIHKKDDTYSIE